MAWVASLQKFGKFEEKHPHEDLFIKVLKVVSIRDGVFILIVLQHFFKQTCSLQLQLLGRKDNKNKRIQNTDKNLR